MQFKLKDIEDIYHAAREKRSGRERAIYLDSVCGEKTALRRQIEDLLEANEQAGDFLTPPGIDMDIIFDNGPLTEQPGSIIGRYKLLEQIGEGGMAVVYMAEQQEPIRRKVALKIIKLGMDTKSVIARFEAERQALAMMDHPNIAKVLDAGATETGRPYFVMELVKGASITDFCDANNLSTHDRLKLFVQVCQAVQHAHQKGIIHRDIKPTNVMVTLHDGKPVPKVIDFGIAKAINQKLTEKTLFTRYAHIIGTPTYMSPEQAELSDLDVDTRTDIYSLGVLLYELLTGTTPFSEEKLREAGYLQMQKIICEEEPAKPSTKLSTLGKALMDVAKQHNSSPELMPRLIRGDLDWIVMKTLEKDRSRRYDTASALAMDVQRHLDNEPILARAPKVMYRLQKFARRHRSQIITFVAISVLIGGMIYIFSKWNQDRHQLAEAEFLTHRHSLSEARGLFNSRDFIAALNMVEPLLYSEHVSFEARLLRASILIEGNQLNKAREELESLLNEKPEIAGLAYALLARIYLESNLNHTAKMEKVTAYRQHAERLLPETADTYFLRAMGALTIKEKLELLGEALDLDPGHYDSLRLRALTYYASRKYEMMKEDARVMVAAASQNPLGYSLQAIALRELGHYEDAIKYYESAIERTQDEDAQIIKLYEECCEIYLYMGEYERAISEAKECLSLFPDETILHFRIFCALIALGQYDEASDLFQQIADSGPESRHRFKDWSMKHVFDTLETGRSWHSPDREPKGVAFLAMLEAEETYHHLSIKAKRLISDSFNASWSPDGTKIVFSLGVPGYSGIATLDPTSQEIDLLIAPGKDPKWSPDGQYIAFVRDCQVLSVPELLASEQPSEFRSYRGEEIWIMNADGTRPRRLSQGSWPSWGQDSRRVYYQWRGQGVHSISVEDRDGEPKPILQLGTDYCSVSPDETYMAGASVGYLRIMDLASQTVVARWSGPGRMWGGNWHPESYQFSLGGTNHAEDRTGLWIYDLDKEQAEKVLSGQIITASWAPNGTELAFSLGAPYFEIWVVGLDPNISTIESLGPGRTLEEHYQEMVDYYSQIIKADPEDAESYRRRAIYHDYLHHEEQVLVDLDNYAAVLKSSKGMNPEDRSIRNLLAGLLRNAPTNLGQKVNSLYEDLAPCISVDGLTLFWGSDRPDGYGARDIWMAERATTEDEWDTPVNLGPTVNSPHRDCSPSISSDGLSLYFHSDRPGGSGSQDIYVTTRATENDSWVEPVNLGPKVNGSSDDRNPAISTDGLSLFFSSTRPGGYGHYDIWVITRKTINDKWEMPVNLGPRVNSATLDSSLGISADGRTLYFTSYRPDGYGWLDIWVTRQKITNGQWSEPSNLGPTVNSQYRDNKPFISADGSTLFFSSERPGGYGKWDLWQVSINPISGSFKEDSDDSNRTSVESSDGKEVMPASKD